MSKPDKAREYFDKANELQTSWSNRNYQSALSEKGVFYETEKKEIHIAALEDERRLMLWLGITDIAVLILALGFLFFLWRWSVQKKRAAQQAKRIAKQQLKQSEQEKLIIATQAVLDGETTERTRLARDLHDGGGSILTGVELSLESMKDIIVQDKAFNSHFSGALDMLGESMVELRRFGDKDGDRAEVGVKGLLYIYFIVGAPGV